MKFTLKHLFLLAFAFYLSACNLLSEPKLDYEPATFEVMGNTLVMSGVIDTNTPATLSKVLQDNPQLTTIRMNLVEGSVDDVANLEAARMVRAKGLNTYVPADGLIASGGTDFFVAGVERVADSGAKVGVHSWATDGISNAALLPKDDPDHQKYLDYYKEMGIPASFYWFTIKAAPSDGMHYMTREELEQYDIIN